VDVACSLNRESNAYRILVRQPPTEQLNFILKTSCNSNINLDFREVGSEVGGT
jgi:hypothetical protein